MTDNIVDTVRGALLFTSLYVIIGAPIAVITRNPAIIGTVVVSCMIIIILTLLIAFERKK